MTGAIGSRKPISPPTTLPSPCPRSRRALPSSQTTPVAPDIRASRESARACPGAGVVSREFSEELGGRLVVVASQSGAVVVGDEGVEIGVAFGMVEKAAVVGGTVLRHPFEMLAEASVEALDHAVGLRPEGLREAVGNGALGADPVEGVVARGFVVGLVFLVGGEAVGEFGAVIPTAASPCSTARV